MESVDHANFFSPNPSGVNIQPYQRSVPAQQIHAQCSQLIVVKVPIVRWRPWSARNECITMYDVASWWQVLCVIKATLFSGSCHRPKCRCIASCASLYQRTDSEAPYSCQTDPHSARSFHFHQANYGQGDGGGALNSTIIDANLL